MNTELLLLAIASVTLLYALLARRINRIGISAPMLATSAGILFGPLVLNLIDASIEQQALILLAELTLVLVLFTDASQMGHHKKHHGKGLAWRLLLLGLPLTISLGTLMAISLLGLSWINALWLALLLAPTDAALSNGILSDHSVRPEVRDSIAFESGLNDGMALPLLMFLLALMHAGDFAYLEDAEQWLRFLVQQFMVGGLAGWAVGHWGGRLIESAHEHHRITPVYQRLSTVSLALIAYAGAEVLGGNGFIAAFSAGLFLAIPVLNPDTGNKQNTPPTEHHRNRLILQLRDFAATEGQQLSLLVFFLFGLVFVATAWPMLEWLHLCYALLCLTLIRILPVVLVLTGTGLSWPDKLFIGWFGPKGIASILYLLISIEQLGYAERIPGYDTVFATSVLTVVLSIFLHGLSPQLRRWLAAS
jgi:NhaP-type Na+/H+ or K+/H+ antiporter